MTRIIMLLNSLDLYLCVSATLATSIWFWMGGKNYYFYTFIGLYRIFLEATAFVTCLLSVTRTMALCMSGYQVNLEVQVNIAHLVLFICIWERAVSHILATITSYHT